MKKGFSHLSPERMKTPVPAPERIGSVNVEEESKIHVSQPFFIGGVEIEGERPPVPPEHEYAKLTRAAAIAFLAHAGVYYGLHDINEIPPQSPEQAEAAARKDATSELMNEWKAESEHNKEIREQLQNERTAEIDHLINVYLDPKSLDYHKETSLETAGRPLPPIDAFIGLDAMNFGISFAEHSSGMLPSIDDIHGRIETQRAHEQAEYDERLDRLIENPNYVWTGKLEEDLVTLRSAMFEGPDRFFSFPNYDETKYQKDNWRVSDQLSTGAVQCTVSRMTPILMDAVYDAKGFDETPLLDLRAAVWSDHIQTAIIRPEGIKKSFAELTVHEPVTDGVRPTATIVSVEAYLAYYLLKSGATPEQMLRVNRRFGLDNPSRFSQNELPSEVMSLDHFDNILRDRQTPEVSNEPSIEPLERTTERIEADLEWQVKRIMYSLLNPGRQELSSYSSKNSFFVEIPRWASNSYLRREALNIHSADHIIYAENILRLWGIGRPDELLDLQTKARVQILQSERLFDLGEIEELFKANSFAKVEALEAFERDQVRQHALTNGWIERYRGAAGDSLDRIGAILRLYEYHQVQLKTHELHLEDPFGSEERIIEILEQNPGVKPLSYCTLQEITVMPLQQLAVSFIYDDRHLAETSLKVVFERLIVNPENDYWIRRHSATFLSGTMKNAYLDWLDNKLVAGYTPDNSWQGSSDLNGLDRSEYAAIAREHPLVFQTYLESEYKFKTEFSQYYAGVYEVLHNKPYTGEVDLNTYRETLGYLPEIENHELDKEILHNYLVTTDQGDRLKILDATVESPRIIIPKNSLYPEDLAAIGDVNNTFHLAIRYRSDAVTREGIVGAKDHPLITDDLRFLLNSDTNQAARIMQMFDEGSLTP